jgi:aldose 1-epimerase
VIAAALLAAATPSVAEVPYGVTRDGRKVTQVVLGNGRGMKARIIGYGAIVTGILVPDRQGRPANVVLSWPSLADYEAKNGNYGMGAVIGRYAGRIAGARFRLDGREYLLAANDGPNALHGGPGGLDTRVWSHRTFRRGGAVGATFAYRSPAGEQGFPGTLDISVTYTLTADDALRIDYEATTDAPTVLNLTNHSYFNLAGAGSGSVLDHRLELAARRFVETDAGGIPTGRFPPVAGTAFDLRRAARIGEVMARPHPLMAGRRGYNHGWLLDGPRGTLRRAARLSDPASGRSLEVLTTEPSIHVYAANWFSGRDVGSEGAAYGPYAGIALETQALPDSPNRPGFPSTVVRPGKPYRSTTIFRFSVLPVKRSSPANAGEDQGARSSPRFRGEGDHAQHGGGASRGKEAPPPPFGWSPSPANAGEDCRARHLS